MILVAEDLDLARGVVQIDEHAAVAQRADAAGDAPRIAGFLARGQRRVARVERRRHIAAGKPDRIRIDPLLAQRLELLQANRAQRIVTIIHAVFRPYFAATSGTLAATVADGVPGPRSTTAL